MSIEKNVAFVYGVSMETKTDYRDILRQDLEIRKSKNESFSLRAYAKLLDLSPSCLSEVFSGKRHLPINKLESVIEKMGLAAEAASHFRTSLRHLRGDFVPQKVIVVPELKITVESHQLQEIEKMMQQFLSTVAERFSNTETTDGKLELRLDVSLQQDL